MNSYLLYENSDKLTGQQYFDAKSIIQDLGLKALFVAAAKAVIYEKDGYSVKKIGMEDAYISDCMRKVMMIPLKTKAEVLYRQEVLRDFGENQDLIRDFYVISSKVLNQWNKLGRGVMERMSNANPVAKVISDIRIISLFAENLHQIKVLLAEHDEKIKSKGLRSFAKRLREEFSDEREEFVQKLLADVLFYTGDKEGDEYVSVIQKPRIVLECGLEEGLKFSSLKLEDVATVDQRFYKPGGAMSKLQDFKNSKIPDSFSTVKETAIRDQTAQLEYQIVYYLAGSMASFVNDFGSFFDSLHQQAAFYFGAVNLTHQMKRFNLAWSFPKVCEKDKLAFTELKEFVMCLEQRVDAVGNTCKMEHKMLLIVTGANQGGKSTFLRSIGIAQVMMQSGMMVTAEHFESDLFPDLFTHFTRREDSEMNSGRLDEELSRMNQIIEHLGEKPLVLLNESFATTTEKEGSVIAYDIIRALVEHGVKILTVTHLLSFAQRMYKESQENPETTVEFLSAERKPGGVRTFKMIQHAPEMTSFGLDLYEEIVEKKELSGGK
jgi:DNA mismatch repair ATPase MutS